MARTQNSELPLNLVLNAKLIEAMENEDNQDSGCLIPTPQWLVLGEIDALNSFWPLVREDEDIGPREAVSVLSTWAHARRFSPETKDASLVERLNALVQGDLTQLVESVLKFDFPDDCVESGKELDEAWDFLIESDKIDDLECAIREMFYSLDRFSLAIYAVGRLAPYLCSSPQFQDLQRRLDSAEEYLQLNADVFLSAAIYASTLFDAYRPDLFDFDQQLWETTLKHRCLQELIDDQLNENQQTKIDPRIFGQLLEGKRESMSSVERVTLEAFRETPPSYLEHGKLDDVQLNVGQKLRSEKQSTTRAPIFSAIESVQNEWHNWNDRQRERREKIEAESSLRQAAEALGTPGIDKVDWNSRLGIVVDDPNVSVQIGQKRLNDVDWELSVSLIGPTTEIAKYQSMEVKFSQSLEQRCGFEHDYSAVQFMHSQSLDSLVLINSTGVRRRVSFEGKIDVE